MKNMLILAAIGIFLCSTVGAFQNSDASGPEVKYPPRTKTPSIRKPPKSGKATTQKSGRTRTRKTTAASSRNTIFKILWTDNCDPREDPDRCQIANNLEISNKFYNVIKSLNGLITYSVPSSKEDLEPYSVVIVDFCSGTANQKSIDAIKEYIRSGGSAFILGGNVCRLDEYFTSWFASQLTGDFGVTFTPRDDLANQWTDSVKKHPATKDVSRLFISRHGYLNVSDTARSIITIDGQPIGAIYDEAGTFIALSDDIGYGWGANGKVVAGDNLVFWRNALDWLISQAEKKRSTSMVQPGNRSPNGTAENNVKSIASSELSPLTAELIIRSTPPNSEILIDEEVIGVTDAEGSLNLPEFIPGTYTVSASKSGHQTSNKKVTLSAGQKETVVFELARATQSLSILSSPPECEVYIDGVFRGITNASGEATIADVTIGEHRVSVRKPRYREATFPLFLSLDKEGRIDATLAPAVGFLTVNANVPRAVVEISGIGRFDNSVSRVKCPPGKYAVTISSPLYVTKKEEVIVSDGKESEVSVDLVADNAARVNLANEVLEAHSNQQYDRAITLAKTLLSVDPGRVRVLTVLAESYFMVDDFDSFTETADLAVAAGGTLEIPLKHHHSDAVMHPVSLVLTARTVSYDPQLPQLPPGSICRTTAFTRDLGEIGSSGLSGNLNNEIYLQLVFAEPGNPKKPTTMTFADRESVFVKKPKSSAARGTSYNGKTMDSRPEAFRAMRSIEAILNRTTAKLKSEKESTMATNQATGRPDKFVVPNGVYISGILETDINTKSSKNRDRFRITVQSPYEFRDAVIEGYILDVRRAGKVTGTSSVTLIFEKITLQRGQTYDFAGNLMSITDQEGKTVKVDNEGNAKGNSQTKETAKRAGVGAGVGAIIGGILGGSTGAAIGAAVGAGAGAGSKALERHDDIKLKKGSTISLQSSSPNRQN